MATSSETVLLPFSETQLGDHAYLSHLASGLNHMREQSAFCDVTIIVGGQRFPAHKAVLACASEYFNRMFTSGFQESATSEITMDVSSKSFNLILDFAYTGYFSLTPETAIDVLKTACFMMFNQAMDNCTKYLSRDEVKEKISIEDCLELFDLARYHDDLASCAEIYHNLVASNFQKFVESEFFIEYAQVDTITTCLDNKEIETELSSEEQVLQGAVNWLRHQWEQRKVHAADVLTKVRLGLVPLARLKEILGDEILAIRECGELVEEVTRLLRTTAGGQGALMRSHPELFASRNTITVAVEICERHEVDGALYVTSYLEKGCYKLGKMAEIDYPSVERHDSMDHSFSLLMTDDNQLYTAGGNVDKRFKHNDEAYHNWNSENNFFKYDSERNEWDVLPPIPETPVHPILVELNGYIYSIDKDHSRRVSVQRYNIASRTWEQLITMCQLGCYIQTAVVVDERLLCMGIDTPSLDPGERDRIPQHIKYMVYDPSTNQWARVNFEPQYLCDNVDDKLFVHNNECYLAKQYGDRSELLALYGAHYEAHGMYRHRHGLALGGNCRVYQLRRNLRGRNPRVKFGDQVDQNIIFGMKLQCYGIPPKHAQFTFDKLRLGMSSKPDACDCFHHRTERGRIVFDYPFGY